MSRKIATVVVGTLSLLVPASPAPAIAADECLSLTAACATDTITVDPDEVVDDPIGTVVDVVDGAEDTTDPVVDPVLDVVDDVLGGGDVLPPPGGSGPRDHESGPGTKGPGRSGRERSSDEPRVSPPGPGVLSREALRPPVTLIGSAANGSRPTIAPHGSPGRFDGFIEGAVRGLLLLSVLFGITVAFVLIQGRLDRNDPKLASAPVRAEIVTFG